MNNDNILNEKIAGTNKTENILWSMKAQQTDAMHENYFP